MVRVLIVLVCAAIPVAIAAQGLSGSAVSGVVRLADGRNPESAIVTLTDINTGARRSVRTGPSALYRFENVDVGTYRLEARSLGSQPGVVDSISLHLGDRVRMDITLGSAPSVLQDAIVRADRLRDPGAGGPSSKIAGRAARNIPLANRDVVNLFQLSSQALGTQGLWISGQHSRYNAIQIDGAAANDFFGVAVTPGSASGGRLISPDAIEEARILVAPFDVRLSGFAGGLISAVTRSGGNARTLSAFASLTRSELIGADTAGQSVPQFNQMQYGLTVSGPVVRDRLHYFIAAEFQRRGSTLVGLSASDSSTGITDATALRIRNTLRDRFGFDPGGTNVPEIDAPTGNFFLKMSWHPRTNLSIELSPSMAVSSRDSLNRSTGTRDGWQLAESGGALFSRTKGALLKANYHNGRVSSESMAGYSSTRFGVRSNLRVPTFLVQADAIGVYVAGGSMVGAQGTRTFESVAQFAHNSSLSIGTHTFFAGTQDFLVSVRDNFLQTTWGAWTFDSVDSLANGRASKYEIALPARPGKPLADYTSLLTSLYVQDQWQPTSRFRITAGIRGDATYLPHPLLNESLLANDTLGNIDTRAIASGNWNFSPRLGFAWTMGSRGRQMLRGGVGLFTARPPFAWTTGVYSFTGETQSVLTCTRAKGVPSPVADIERMPTECSGADGKSAAKPSVMYFKRDFETPQSFKAALGFDSEFAQAWTASFNVVAARTINQMTISDRNLQFVSTNAEQRAMYGSIPAIGAAEPARLSQSYGGVYRLANYSADRSVSANVIVRREWSEDKLIDIEYTWSRTRDVLGLTGFSPQLLNRNSPVSGTVDPRKLERSGRDIPHSFVGMAVFPARAGFVGSFFVRARSGTPWSFTVGGDANADGASGNDPAYIPRDSLDVSLRNPATFRALDDLIEGLGCARAQRGHMMERNSCRNPSVVRMDGRISKSFSQSRARRFEVAADLFNIANLLNRRWGIMRETANREDVQLMTVSGWDNTRNRPVYLISTPPSGVPILPSINKALVDASRWSVQLSGRYDF